MIVFAVIYGVNVLLGFIGNLLVILVVSIYRRFYHMRYFLLASLALSDFFFTNLITAFRMLAYGIGKWIFGTAWCYGTAYFARFLHLSTVLHLCAVSYERYEAIFKNPLTYYGCITKKRAIVSITLMWIIPAGISLGPFLGWSDYVYNPAIMVCEQKWDMVTTLPLLATTFLVPLGIIVFLNYRVLKVVSRLQSSFKIIPVTVVEQPGTGHPAEQNGQNQSEKQGKVKRERNLHFSDLLARNEEGETAKPSRKHHVIKQGNLKGSVYAEGGQNPAFQEEIEEIQEVRHQPVFVQKNEGSSESRCSSPVQWSRKSSRRKPAMKGTESMKEGINSILHSTHSSLNDYRSPQQIANQEKQSHEEDDIVVCIVNPHQGKTKKNQTMLKGSSKSNMSKENTGGHDIFQGTEREGKPGSHQSDTETIVRQPQDRKAPSAENQRNRLGKTQKRLVKLLKEGKAARDVIIVIGIFLLCYLPTWVSACYRMFGGEQSVEVILSAHSIYATTMFWNPIIYSIRKNDFRQAVRRLLRL
ncbi:unnamed protein product [Porites evermanni]|uniref:G-protein coupled receptors family 1 profile domain-containing protein n=1 Tax=Porites evermanni TaxID=104178 RepID=A0ABN8LCG2_9CNID|nr:unnamed protein product [Porites evermanni]